jgi:hypothetical protein
LAKLRWCHAGVGHYDVAGLPDWPKKTHHDRQVTGIASTILLAIACFGGTASGMEAE